MDNLNVNTSLDVVSYVSMVENIVSEYFNENGEFTPHIGRLNAMRLFYNNCVLDDIDNLPHDISDALQLNPLVANEAFMDAYNIALDVNSAKSQNLTFGVAYLEAMDIVYAKNNSITQAIDVLKVILGKFVDALSSVFTEDNMNRIEKITNDIASGKISNESIVDAVGKSDFIQKIAGGKQ